MPSRLRRFCLWTLVFAAVLLVVSEVYLRMRGYSPKPFLHGQPLSDSECRSPQYIVGERRLHPLLGWTSPEGQIMPTEGCREAATVLADGRRRSYSADRPRTKRGVALLGCSFTYGTGVADSDTFAWRLNERYPELTFDNFGVEGYSADQCLLLMQRLLEEPQAISAEVADTPYELFIYSGIYDHLFRNRAYNTFFLSDGRMFVYPPAGSGHVFSPRLYESYWYGEDRLASLYFWHRLQISSYMKYNELLRDKVIMKRQDSSWELMAEIVAAMNQLAAERGARFACVGMDVPFCASMKNRLADKDISFIDATLMGRDHPECFNKVRNRFAHPNAAGHSYFAERIADWIDRVRYFSGSPSQSTVLLKP
ncbi:hypothetical protein IJT17_08375 [bacterium]|nr:hypothetical protein [bacterium]